jgi:hypothetical protein
VAEPVHPDDPPHVLAVDLDQAPERCDAREQDDGQQEQRKGHESAIEAHDAGNERESHH